MFPQQTTLHLHRCRTSLSAGMRRQQATFRRQCSRATGLRRPHRPHTLDMALLLLPTTLRRRAEPLVTADTGVATVNSRVAAGTEQAAFR